jgi:hypothetical protein
MKNNFFSASLYSRTRITSKTVLHIMEDNFAFCYVLKHPSVNSRAELVPSPRAYALGDYFITKYRPYWNVIVAIETAIA